MYYSAVMSVESKTVAPVAREYRANRLLSAAAAAGDLPVPLDVARAVVRELWRRERRYQVDRQFARRLSAARERNAELSEQ